MPTVNLAARMACGFEGDGIKRFVFGETVVRVDTSLSPDWDAVAEEALVKAHNH